MFYEEKVIDGVLMFRSTPNGTWKVKEQFMKCRKFLVAVTWVDMYNVTRFESRIFADLSIGEGTMVNEQFLIWVVTSYNFPVHVTIVQPLEDYEWVKIN